MHRRRRRRRCAVVGEVAAVNKGRHAAATASGSCTSERTKERSSADSSWPMSHTARILRGGPSAICRGVRLAVNQNTWLHASLVGRPRGNCTWAPARGRQGHRVHHAASPGLAPVLELTRLARLGLGEVRRGVRAGGGRGRVRTPRPNPWGRQCATSQSSPSSPTPSERCVPEGM